MKNNKLLNSEINYEISKLGHTDYICVSDVNFPIPSNVKRIDLAIKKNLPKFIDVVSSIQSEMHIEKIILSSEIKKHNEPILKEIKKLFKDIEIEFMPIDVFKEKTKQSKTIIRTGESSPYANIIIISGLNLG